MATDNNLSYIFVSKTGRSYFISPKLSNLYTEVFPFCYQIFQREGSIIGPKVSIDKIQSGIDWSEGITA
jgi:hypothetical protein